MPKQPPQSPSTLTQFLVNFALTELANANATVINRLFATARMQPTKSPVPHPEYGGFNEAQLQELCDLVCEKCPKLRGIAQSNLRQALAKLRVQSGDSGAAKPSEMEGKSAGAAGKAKEKEPALAAASADPFDSININSDAI